MFKKIIPYIALIVPIGCQGSSSSSMPDRYEIREHEAWFKDMIAGQSEIAEALESITDESTGKAATPKIKKAAQQLVDLKKRAHDLVPPSVDQQKYLQSTYAQIFHASLDRIVAAAPNKNKASADDAAAIDSALDSLTKR